MKNIINVSWGDHKSYEKSGDSQLLTLDAIERRMKMWKDKLNIEKIYWRGIRKAEHKPFNSFHNMICKKPKAKATDVEDHEVPAIAHRMGMKIYLYVHLFDEGWPLPSLKERKVSYHSTKVQYTARMSRFAYEHPEYHRVDRSGTKRQWGVLSLAYPEVRKYFREHFINLIDDTDFDGLFICLRSQSKPADFADQFEFNEPVRKDHYKDICNDDFDLDTWRYLLGSYLTEFIREIRKDLNDKNKSLAIGIPTGDILGPPIGNTIIDWRKWIEEDLINDLIINQNSTYCPSVLNRLWPMHRGYGYIQNYTTGYKILSLWSCLNRDYLPCIKNSSTDLYVSTQWDVVQSHKGRDLPVSNDYGFVYGSFEFDNPGIVEKLSAGQCKPLK